MKYTATVPFLYNGKILSVGDTFEANETLGNAFITINRAKPYVEEPKKKAKKESKEID